MVRRGKFNITYHRHLICCWARNTHVEKVVIVCIRHVELTSSELGIMGQVDSLISKLSPDLVDTLKATDDKLF